MKQLILSAIIALWACHAIAQTEDTTYVANKNETTLAYKDAMDRFLLNVKPNDVPTGVLYDRVNPIADATNLKQGDTLTTERALQLWHELYNATYKFSNPQWSLQGIIKASAASKAISEAMPIGYINYAFNYLDSTTMSNSVVDEAVNTLKFTCSPTYNSKTIILPILFTHRLEGDSVLLYFDSTLSLANVNEEILSIQVKLPNGEFVTLSKGEKKYLNLTNITAEAKSIVLSFNVGTAVSKYGYSYDYNYTKVKKTRAFASTAGISCLPVSTSSLQFTSGASLKFQGYGETTPSEAIGKYKIYYKLNNLTDNTLIGKKLTKPIILIDGIDFLDGERNSPDKIYDLFSYDNGNQHLGNDLRLKGYDIIVLNFPMYPLYPLPLPIQKACHLCNWRDGGTDYMERNGLLLERLLIMVDSIMQHDVPGTTEKISIIGPSMGGQISRYALKDMEDKGIPHNVKLWCAFDSPHHGANIPMGIQGMTWFAAMKLGNAGADSSYFFKIRSIAARQLLIHQLGELNSSNEPTMYDSYRATWQAMIDAKGFPQNLRKIALINGTADLPGYNLPGGKMFQYDVTKHGNPWQGFLLSSFEPRFLNNSNTTKSIFDGYKYGPFGSLYSHLTYTNNKVYENLDGVMGSTLQTGLDAYNALETGKISSPVASITAYKYVGGIKIGTLFSIPVMYGDGNKFDFKGTGLNTFIPTWSALAIKNRNYSWHTSLNEDLTCSGKTPFDDYMTAATNEPHVFISGASAAWALAQIDQGDSKCPQVCGNTLLGADRMCIGDIKVFTLQNSVPTNVAINWTTSAGLTFVSSGSSATVTCTANNAAAWVKVGLRPKIGSAFCRDEKTYSYNVIAGSPSILQGVWFGRVGTNACNYAAYVTNLKSYNTLEWSHDGINFIAGANGYEPPTMLIPAPGNNIPIWVKIYDGCGTVMLKKVFFTKTVLDPGCVIAYKKELVKLPAIKENYRCEIFPNPTSSDWNIMIYDYLNKHITIELLDLSGKVHWQNFYQNLESGNVTVPAASLPSGTYILRVQTDKNINTQKVIKQ
jgi:hypothetical protein